MVQVIFYYHRLQDGLSVLFICVDGKLVAEDYDAAGTLHEAAGQVGLLLRGAFDVVQFLHILVIHH